MAETDYQLCHCQLVKETQTDGEIDRSFYFVFLCLFLVTTLPIGTFCMDVMFLILKIEEMPIILSISVY